MSYPAGHLSCRARFERRIAEYDGYGNERGSFAEVTTLACSFVPDFKAERIEAGAPSSGLQGVVTLHASAMAKSLRPEDRLVFVGGPYKGSAPLRIRSILPRQDGATIEMKVETGAS